MKTIVSACALTTCVFLTATESVEAQWSRTRGHRRVVVSQPTSTVQSSVVTYGGFSHIDDLAIEMEQRARAILWEMHFHYRRNVDYDVTYAEAYEMLNQAKFIHHAEHRGDRAAIRRAVTQLDELFHHVEEDIRSWRPARRHFGRHGDLFEKMEAMELTLHHLMEDVDLTSSTTDPPAPGLNPPPPTLQGAPRR